MLDFLRFRILFVISEGEIREKKVLEELVGLEPVKGGKF